MASASSDIDVALEELEARLERLRALYEQYFIGIEKLEPSVPRQDVDRRIYALRKIQIRNTAKRFKLQTIIQRYNAFQQYWLRICREIENGTYHRHVARAQSRFGDVPLTAAARRRARLQGPQNQTDEQKTASAEKAKARKEADDDLEALLGEDLDAALSRALVAADHVEITRVEPATLSVPVQGAPVATAGEMPSKAPSVAPPRPNLVASIEAVAPAKSLAPRPPPRTKPTVGVTAEATAATAAASSPAVAASDPAPIIPLKPSAGESPAAVARAKAPALPPARRAPAKAEVPSANPPAQNAPVAERPGPGVPTPVAAAGAGTSPAAGATKPARSDASAVAPVAGRVARPVGAAPPAPAAAAPPAPPGEQQTARKGGAAPAGAAPPVAAGTKPARAKEAVVPKAKPSTAAAKAAERMDGWAALRPPTAERGAHAATGAESTSASSPVQTTKSTAAAARPAGKAPPKTEPARADASKPQAPAPPPAPPIPAQAGAAEPKKMQPKAVPADVAAHAPGTRVTTTASPRTAAEPEATGPSAEERAAAGRAAAARAAEIRSQAQAPPQSAGMDDQRLSQLHGALVAERRRLNQPGKVSKDALAASLRDTESKLRKQYGDKQIDFHVVVKDGKAVVKPIVG